MTTYLQIFRIEYLFALKNKATINRFYNVEVKNMYKLLDLTIIKSK